MCIRDSYNTNQDKRNRFLLNGSLKYQITDWLNAEIKAGSDMYFTCLLYTSATGEGVIGASVVVKGTTIGTITGLDGDFSLSNVKEGDIIVISFVGYATQELSLIHI